MAPSIHLGHILPLAIVLLVAIPVAVLLRNRYRRGLCDIPGPFLASILPFDRMLSTYSGHQFQRHLDYHAKYGKLVRVGPNHVSLGDSEQISHVYSITSKFDKSNFYTLFHAKSPVGPIPTVFSIVDPVGHKNLKRPVGAAFALSSLLDFEPLADDCTRILERKLDALQGQDIDFGTWLHWYAFDVISSITFSNRLGFMENEEDVNGIIAAIEGRLFYNSIIGQVPWMHQWLLGNNFVSRLADKIPSIKRLNSAAYIVQFAARQLQLRQNVKAEHGRSDMLDKFKRTRDGEEVMSEKELLGHASSNVFAGSDTTAISLRALFYHLCKNPQAYQKCVDEILDFDARGELSEYVTYYEAQRMPYFQTCMREALRMHPAVGQLLERIVPEGGATIDGVHLPAGTIVGMNPWVAARDTAVYGHDADIFRPERWIEADERTLKLMDRNWLAFGAGARTCLGKNISLMEMSKLVPQLLRRYHVKLADPNAEWELFDYWFVKQEGLRCILSRRGKQQ
ncbi:Pisatin demethylase [Cladophialophora carrionii]|uniref:Pisatin demethylase n=1 Tax=Cladophialophora carrionii TaxID=86049 RepID=A0A1C1CAD7_9EURO|nr:Pisatin demethylase [Cladophialophora carrionii]